MWKKILTVLLVVPMMVWTLAGCGTTSKANGQSNSKSESASSSKSTTTSTSQSSENKTVKGDLPPLKNPVTVKIAEDGSASGAGFYIAKDKGYFKQYNINAKFVKFQNSDQMLPALAAGKIDVAGGISSASFFNSIAQGIEGKLTNKRT